MTDRTSYENTLNWLKEIKTHAEEGIVVLLIGNKKDLVQETPSSRQVTESEAKEFAAKYKLYYRETSAKTGDNVKESFEYLVESKKESIFVCDAV